MLNKILDRAQTLKDELSQVRRRLKGMEGKQPQYKNIFATPLFTYIWQDAPELNAVLRERILAYEAANPGTQKSNQGGWHSETGQLEFLGDGGRRLVEHIYEYADHATRRVYLAHRQPIETIKWTLEVWVNVNRAGDFNKVHIHPGSTWSGTYYVDAGDPSDSAEGAPLHLFDPLEQSSFLPSVVQSSVYIDPKPGLMILFPSYVPHMVFPHRGKGTRISIAFNLRKQPYP